MMEYIADARTSLYLPKTIASSKVDLDTNDYYFDHTKNALDCKLLTKNPYHSYFKQLYPSSINPHELTHDMLDVIKSYTDSQSNECYMKTNLNLLSANFDDIDWTYVNKLRSLIRGLVQTDIKHMYYRGLTLSDREIQYYLDRRDGYYYTNSFTSVTVDRLLVYSGNVVMMLRTDTCSDKAKINLANIWQWSTFCNEKEALVAVGTRMKVLSVHYLGCKWEIEVELAEEEDTN
ncbi:unnamed protein product [Adineta ricciae]|uniref:Uncharacterized protein n=1 Tax=Adineta ricciae TaxID=249248 RepID=A0A815KLS4_ADIRI|nr:unnamed protein product [Adineta ricciae]